MIKKKKNSYCNYLCIRINGQYTLFILVLQNLWFLKIKYPLTTFLLNYPKRSHCNINHIILTIDDVTLGF